MQKGNEMKLIRYEKEREYTADGGGVLLLTQADAKAYFASSEPELSLQLGRLRALSGRMELVGENAYFVSLSVPDTGENKLKGKIGLYTDFDKFCTVVADCPAAAEALEAKLPLSHSYAGLLCQLLESMTADDYLALEEIEKSVNLLEEKLIEDKAPDNTVSVIVDYRKRLMRLKQFYEQLTEILEGLAVNKIVLPARDRTIHQNMVGRLSRLLSRVRDLRDGVSQVREAYQSQVDIGQNRLMKLFTIITAIFLPLQLIVGWYGMNLVMPETAFKITYPIVAFACAAIVAVCLVLFKKHRWFK